jgi:hypothetical protein
MMTIGLPFVSLDGERGPEPEEAISCLPSWHFQLSLPPGGLGLSDPIMAGILEHQKFERYVN